MDKQGLSAADYLVVVLMIAVAVVLVMGLINMFRGKDPQKSNRLMVWRVVLQGAVILLAALFLAKA